MTAITAMARSAGRPVRTAAVLALCFSAATALSLALAALGYAAA